MSSADTFEQALDRAGNHSERNHVLLGNGFSIACRPHIFTYSALLERATFGGCSIDAGDVFKALGTVDFERAVQGLRITSAVAPLYVNDKPQLSAQLTADAGIIRDALANVLAANHPELPFDLTDDECASARRFLAHFERIYTLNYDLLLYWALRREGEPEIKDDDGFRWPGHEAEYVAWDWAKNPMQSVFYLHGALHLYEQGPETCKYTWSQTGVRLIDQIRAALGEGKFPLVVTEGDSAGKLAKIMHSSYLSFGIRRFATVACNLFVFGHALAANDEHILDLVVRGKVRTLFVSLHGNPKSEANRTIKARAAAIAARRTEKRPLDVFFFDAESAGVWK